MKLTIFEVIPDLIRVRIAQTEFSENFHRGQYKGSIGEFAMNIDSIFIWIFIYSCPNGYKKLNLTIFGVISDLIWGRIDKLIF